MEDISHGEQETWRARSFSCLSPNEATFNIRLNFPELVFQYTAEVPKLNPGGLAESKDTMAHPEGGGEKENQKCLEIGPDLEGGEISVTYPLGKS